MDITFKYHDYIILQADRRLMRMNYMTEYTISSPVVTFKCYLGKTDMMFVDFAGKWDV